MPSAVSECQEYEAQPPLPLSTSPSLALKHPTAAERSRTWALTHPFWGPALTVDSYLRREDYLTTVALARDGGITHWVLTDAEAETQGTGASQQQPHQRRVYATCETLRKRAFVCGPETGGRVHEGVAHGVGSVFTEEVLRGRGYAGRMMTELGRRLERWDRAAAPAATAVPADGSGNGEAATMNGASAGGQQTSTPTSLFSVLYSDIGKKFYARTGWEPFASSHVEFPPLGDTQNSEQAGRNGSHEANGEAAGHRGAKSITLSDLPELCAVDERLLREALARQAAEAARTDGAKKTCVALVPDLDTMHWHLTREDYMTNHVLGRTPSVRGAVFGEAGKRIWAVFARNYYSGVDGAGSNTLYILRLVVEDEGSAQEYLAEGLRSVVNVARAEAGAWRCKNVQMWNPPRNVKDALEKSGVEFKFVERDSDSIASLLWFGKTSAADLDWVANEKYGWC